MADRDSPESTMDGAPAGRPAGSIVPLGSVLCTELLSSRQGRPPDYEKECRMLTTLVQALADSPLTIPQVLVDALLEDFDLDSAGVSLLTSDEKSFYWAAIAGLWKPHIGGSIPRDFSPGGDALDRRTPLLFRRIERRYAYFLPVTPPVEECLVVPFYVKGKAVGTIWAIAQNDRRKFDAEDVRCIISVGRFASVASESISTSEAAQESRRAALNVMEDAVDARKAAESLNVELRASEDRYRTLFDSIDEGFCIIEKVDNGMGRKPDFRYVEVNPAFSQQSGLTGVVGKTIRQMLPGESDSWISTYDSVLRTGEAVRFERALASTARIFELYAFRIGDETHRRIAVIFKDITERKQAESLNSRLAAIVESSADAILGQDLEGIITSWNLGAERLFGYTPEEAVGQRNTLLIPPDLLANESVVQDLVRRGETVAPYETVRRGKTGARIAVALTISPIRDYQGRAVGASKIYRDVSESMKIAEALRESDRHKDNFLAMLAHELRNPLAPIRNALEIIRRGRSRDSSTPFRAPPGKGNEAPIFDDAGDSVSLAVDMLDRQVGLLVRLIDDLLDVNRISRGKIELRMEHVELSSLLRQVVESTHPRSESLCHELTVTLPPDPLYLSADPARLAQMVGNLVNNACKFTDPGGHIWLEAERVADSDVIIRVRDTGIGIAPEELPRIFEMFTQLDRSLERSMSGLGLGLSLVKTLAQMHGGVVEAHSAGPNQGAEFVIRIPMAAQQPTQAAQPPVEERPVAPALRILVVDDNLDAAKSLAVLLHLTGHEAHMAHDGLAAVEAAARLEPDVILLDIGLPKLNGYEAARRIRQQQSAKRPLLVAVTGWGMDEDRRRSKEAGFDTHIVKPMDHTALRRLLAEIAAGGREA